MSDIFLNKSLQFSTTVVDTTLIPLPRQDTNTDNKSFFGVLDISLHPVDNSEEEYDIICSVDQSGSMSDLCQDGRTKNHHSIHTLTNIIHYIEENPTKIIYLTVLSFDDKVYEILNRTRIDSSNLGTIIAKITNIYPRGSTNIELPLKKVYEISTEIIAESPNSNIVHIFMTDGEVNIGEKSSTELKKLLHKKVENHFIGYGVDHNSELLSDIVKESCHNSYRFVDKLENIGMIYGEILDEIFNKTIRKAQLNIINGLVYDFKKNTWGVSLYIGDIISNMNKNYHIVSENPSNCSVVLIGEMPKHTEQIFTIESNDLNANLNNFIFRQRTMQLLYRSKNTNTTNSTKNIFPGGFNIETNVLHEEATAFLKEMKEFMEVNQLNTDKIMLNLCDDIYICLETMNSKYNNMYINSRLVSQGTQRCYAANHLPQMEHSFSRQFGNACFPSPPRLDHQLSDMRHNPYITPRAVDLMRSCSNGSESADINQVELENL
jgi:hypothetical protein